MNCSPKLFKVSMVCAMLFNMSSGVSFTFSVFDWPRYEAINGFFEYVSVEGSSSSTIGVA